MAPDDKLKPGDTLLHEFLADVQTIRCSELASSTIIIFDHLLTLEQEYRLIWTAPWSFGKCLFLINRYYTLITVIFNNYALFSDSLSDSVSLHWYRWQGWTGVTAFVVAELILLLRLYALYFLNRRVLVFMACTSVLAFAASAGVMGSVLAQITATAHPFSTHPTPFCAATNVPAYAYAFWVPMLASECVLCALAVSRFVHMHRTRAGATLFQNGRRLVGALIVDSVWYFVVMFATYLANTIVFVVGTATEFEIPIGFSVAFACVLANRLCLNTRGMVRRSADPSFSTSSSFFSSSAIDGSGSAHSYPPRRRRTGEDGDEDMEETWGDGLGIDSEYAEYDGYEYADDESGSGSGSGSSRQHIVSTPVHSPRTATEVGVEGGERLDAIQMRELRRMRSSRRIGVGGGWGRAGRARWIGRREAECENVGVVTV